jgi:hypothetical protein
MDHPLAVEIPKSKQNAGNQKFRLFLAESFLGEVRSEVTTRQVIEEQV